MRDDVSSVLLVGACLFAGCAYALALLLNFCKRMEFLEPEETDLRLDLEEEDE